MENFYRACKEGNLKEVKRFVKEGCDVNKKDGGYLRNEKTPLMYAAGEGRCDVVVYLIDRGAAVSKKDSRKRTALHYASERGHLKVVDLLLTKGADIDVEDEDRCTPLHLAFRSRDSDISLRLINHGADVGKKDDRERTALHYAVKSGHLKVVELLLNKCAKIDVEDRYYHHTPLMLAAGRGYNDILLYLINRGADVSKKNTHKQTPLHYATEGGHLKVVQLLLSKGAKVNVGDMYLRTPLMLAAGRGYNDILLCLIKHGADVNTRNRNKKTALFFAIESGHLKVVELLLRNSAEIDVEDQDRHTPLMLAAERGHSDISIYLINHDADVGKKDSRKQTPLHYATESGHLEVVKILLSKGAKIDVGDEYCHTPLMLAAGMGYNDILLCLINCDADVNQKDGCERTALHYATEGGHLKAVELLLVKGAKIDVEDDNCHTPLMLAAERGHSDISLYLVNHNADVSKKDGQKRTALHYASESGHSKVVELVLSNGAKIDAEDKDGCTPLMMAAGKGHIDISLYFIQHGADVRKTNYHNQTALHYASENGKLRMVELLLSKGAEIEVEDEDNCTPLILAFKYQKLPIVCCLIEAGANVKLVANYLSDDWKHRNLKRKSLSYAINYHHIAVATVLIINGIGIEGQLDTIPPRTALIWSIENGYNLLVWILILQGVNVNYRDANGSSALHFAASLNNTQSGILLVEAGANVRLVNKASATPLDMASQNFKDAIVQTLSFNTKKTVCVIGNAYSGKSTLIASLQNENAKLLTKIRHRLFGVKDISDRTAGIEPVSLSSKRYGDTVFLDFAGQHEYHGPHEMFLESILSKSRSTMTIIVVVKVTEVEKTISEQLDRWLHPVSMMASKTNPIRVILIGSHIDKAVSKQEVKKKLERCYEAVQQSLCGTSLEFLDACYLNCRQPYSSDIGKLCAYLNKVPIPEHKATEMPYSISWVISRMKTSLDVKAIQVADFAMWTEKHRTNLPSDLPPAEEVCKDLSSTGHFLYLPNKEKLSNGWLILDLPAILHEVYGTLFSPSKKIINKFGLLNCQKLSALFPTLDRGMIHDVLVSLEFCIDMDPSILPEEVIQLTEGIDKDEHLFFPALVSYQPPKVFTSSQQGCHVLSWQLVVDKKPFISSRLLQTIILRLAAHHIIYFMRGSDTKEHYCSVWQNGIFWQSTDGHDVAVQISNNTVLEVIGISDAGPENLSLYISTITRDIFATVHELSPTLSAASYIIHPVDPQVLLENPRSASPHQMFPVEVILESVKNDKMFCLSQMTPNEPALKVSITEIFCGFQPSIELIQRLCFSHETCEFGCIICWHVFIYACHIHLC